MLEIPGTARPLRTVVCQSRDVPDHYQIKTMNAITRTALKDVAAALVGLLPGGDLLKGSAREVVEAAASIWSKKEKDAVESVANEIFAILAKNPEALSPGDPGRAVSAAYNVLETVRLSSLDADRIIDCELDPAQLYSYLLLFPAPGIESASGGRSVLYHRYLRSFADKVVDAVFQTALFQRRLHQRLLGNQRKIMRSLEQHFSADKGEKNLGL
jgi:hypothetical protein